MDKVTKRAFEIADEAAKSYVESACRWIRIRGVEWVDTRTVHPPSARREIKRDIAYLEARGLLIWHRRRLGLARWKEGGWLNDVELKRQRLG